RDPETGHLKKRKFGPWMMTAFRFLAGLKGLRGTALDIFGRTPERRMERQLIVDYFALIEQIVATLTQPNHRISLAFAAVTERIRGWGHVKEARLNTRKGREAALLAQFRAPTPAPFAQAAE